MKEIASHHLVFFVIIILFSACNKETPDATPTANPIVCYMTDLVEGMYPIVLTWDGGKYTKITIYIDSIKENELSHYDISYNDSNLISSATSITSNGKKYGLTKFEYNSSNLMIKEIHVKHDSSGVEIPPKYYQTFDWSGDRLLTKKSSFSDNDLYEYTTFTVVGGNYTKQQRYDANDSLLSEKTFEYDTKKQVFGSLVNFGGFFGAKYCKNNVVKSVRKRSNGLIDSTVTHIYLYNTSDYPIKQEISLNGVKIFGATYSFDCK